MQKIKKDDSVVLIVADMLVEGDRDSSERFHQTFSHQAASQHDEIVELNRYWRGQLSKLSINTISERECLIDAIDPTDWLRHFRSQVLPTILRFKLPKTA